MKKSIFVLALCFIFIQQAKSEGEGVRYFDLPQDISEINTQVNFEVDSTWHLVKGKIKQIKGKVWLENQQDYLSVKADIIFPVASFDTDNSMRDSKMREILGETKFPEAKFQLNSLKTDCILENLKDQQECSGKISGVLTIRGKSLLVEFPANASLSNNNYEIKGSLTLLWRDYGIEDPSIPIVATLDDEVKVNFKTKIKKAESQNIGRSPS